jgi:hypothetical protein
MDDCEELMPEWLNFVPWSDKDETQCGGCKNMPMN